MIGDDTRFLTGTDEHSVNIAQRAAEEGRPPREFVDEKVALFKRGRGRPRDLARPVHPDDRPRPRPGGPGDGPAGPRQRRHLSRHLRGLVLPERGLPQRHPTSWRRASGDDCPNHPDVPLQWLTETQLVLPPVGLPGAPRAALRRAPGLRPAGVPAQRDARVHPAGPRGLLDQPRRRATGASRSRSPRTARPPSARTARGIPRPARSTSGTTRSSTTSPAPASRTTPTRSRSGGRPTCTSSARTSPASTRSTGRRCCGAPASRRPARSGSTAGCSPRGERMSKSRGNFLDPADAVAAFGADGARYVTLREVAFDRDAEVSLGFVRPALQRRPGQRLRQPRQPDRDDGRPLPRRRAAGIRAAGRLPLADGWSARLERLPRTARGAACSTRRWRSCGTSSAPRTRSSTPSSRGSSPRPPRPATRRRGRGCGRSSATSSRRAGWSALAAAPFMPAIGAARPGAARLRVSVRRRRQRRPAAARRAALGRPRRRAGRRRDAGAAVPAARDRGRGSTRPRLRVTAARRAGPPMRLVDSHCHLQADRFARDVELVLGAARLAGVERILVPGWNVASSRGAARARGPLPWLDAAVGVHPHDAATVDDAGWARDRRPWPADPRVVGDRRDRPRLRPRLLAARRPAGQPAAQPRARARDGQAGDPPLPLRRPAGATPRTRSSRELRGRRSGPTTARRAFGRRPPAVIHSFSGPVDYAGTVLELGLAISFSGLVFRRGEEPSAEVAALVPADRLLVETDSPFLPPPGAPRRRNEPEWVGRDGRWLAEQRDPRTPRRVGAGLIAAYDRMPATNTRSASRASSGHDASTTPACRDRVRQPRPDRDRRRRLHGEPRPGLVRCRPLRAGGRDALGQRFGRLDRTAAPVRRRPSRIVRAGDRARRRCRRSRREPARSPAHGRLASDTLIDAIARGDDRRSATDVRLRHAPARGRRRARRSRSDSCEPPFSMAGSGQSVTVAGERFLKVRMAGMVVDRPNGEPVYTGQRDLRLAGEAISQATMVDESEGVVDLVSSGWQAPAVRSSRRRRWAARRSSSSPLAESARHDCRSRAPPPRGRLDTGEATPLQCWHSHIESAKRRDRRRGRWTVHRVGTSRRAQHTGAGSADASACGNGIRSVDGDSAVTGGLHLGHRHRDLDEASPAGRSRRHQAHRRARR